MHAQYHKYLHNGFKRGNLHKHNIFLHTYDTRTHHKRSRLQDLSELMTPQRYPSSNTFLNHDSIEALRLYGEEIYHATSGTQESPELARVGIGKINSSFGEN